MNFSYDDVIEHSNMNAIGAGMEGDGVWSGLAITQRGTGANMSVDVALGDCRVNGTNYSETGTTNVVITTAHATLNRRDIIIYDTTADTPAIVNGTAATEPYPPDIPSGDILLAVIYVDAAVTVISNADIMDGRVSVKSVIPSGMISMWHGLISAIPFGWVKCDGTNGTPDLRAKFVRGAPGTTEAGGTGGADTHTLTVGEMPAHTHNIKGSNASGASDTRLLAASATQNVANSAADSVGGAGAHNNLPSYYAVIFIMKT